MKDQLHYLFFAQYSFDLTDLGRRLRGDVVGVKVSECVGFLQARGASNQKKERRQFRSK